MSEKTYPVLRIDSKNESAILQKRGTTIIFGFIVFLLIIQNVQAADSMYRGNPQHTGEYPSAGIIPGNKEIWRFPTGVTEGTIPAVANGIVYVGGSPVLYAIDSTTGTEKWEFTRGNKIFSPAVANGIVYVGSDDNHLYALEAKTGMEKWRFTTLKNVTTSPIVSNGAVYFGCVENLTYALDANTGEKKWSSDQASIESSPAYDNGRVYFVNKNYFGDRGEIYALDAANGEKKWTFSSLFGRFTSPALSNGIVYCSDTANGIVYALDATTGIQKWNISSFENPTSPAISHGLLYIGETTSHYDSSHNNNYNFLSNRIYENSNVYAFSATNGDMKWRFKLDGSFVSDPVLSNDVLYLGSKSGTFYAINALNGKEIWHVVLGGSVVTDPVINNGVVYVGSDDGILYALGELKPASATVQPSVSTLQMPETSSPALSEKVQATISPQSPLSDGQSSPAPISVSDNGPFNIAFIIIAVLLIIVDITWFLRNYLKKYSVFLSGTITTIENYDWTTIRKMLSTLFITIVILVIVWTIIYQSLSFPVVVIGGLSLINAILALKK